jgi:TRAP-type mannitol/chloroaromatic compound transport system substrate-binding protein
MACNLLITYGSLPMVGNILFNILTSRNSLINKRQLLKNGLLTGAAGAASTLAAPAIAQSLPNLRWRLASSFPKSLDTIYSGAKVLANRLAAITGGKFQISVHAVGELMPAFGVMDAVQGGSIACNYRIVLLCR